MPYYNDLYMPPPPVGSGGRSSGRREERKSVVAKGLVVIGIIQILLGLLIIFIGVYRLIAACQLANLVTGTWVGAFIVIEGIIGIIAGQNRGEKTLTTFSVLSFLAMVLAIILVGIEGVALIREVENCDPATNACVDEPFPRWAIPSLYALERRYLDDYLARRANPRTSPARRYDSSTQTQTARFDDDRYKFP